jgi:hypothetical protein
LDYEAGDSPEGEPNIIVFLASVGVKDNRRISTGFSLAMQRDYSDLSPIGQFLGAFDRTLD